MFRFSFGVLRMDDIRNEQMRGTAHVGRFGDKIRGARLRFFVHLQKKSVNMLIEGFPIEMRRFCAEFPCSPCVRVGLLRVLQFPPTVNM